MLFPLIHRWMIQAWSCSELQAAGVTAVFGIALFLPGAFNNYLVDTFSRKNVCTRSIMLLALVGILYPYVSSVEMVVLLRILQGALFGIVLMATGSTLAIDVTPSNNRNAANRVFTWSSIVGMLSGIIIGIEGGNYLSFDTLLYFSAFLCAVAIVLVSMVTVCFRAPLDLPLCSFDRFILFRTLLPGINMMTVPMVLGMLFIMISNAFFYLCIGSGFLIYLLVRQVFTRPMNGRIQIFIGQLFTGAGLMLLCDADTGEYLYGAGLLVGIGVGFSIGQFLRMMILLPLHCERGTGYHTYQLLWETGVMLGIWISQYVRQAGNNNPYQVALGICVIGFLLYQVYIHRYFTKHYQTN
nr:MFS transporter [Phocaeicola coprocola]